MCDYDNGGESCSVWNERPRKARKAHHCEACGAAIPAGATYTYASGVFDGRGWDSRWCAACDGAFQAFKAAHSQWPSITELSDALYECMRSADGAAEALKWGRHYIAMRRRSSAARAVAP